MIPTIENIVEGLVIGQYSKSQVVTWLHQHSENALQDLRDYFAAKAMNAYIDAQLLLGSMTNKECELVIANTANFSYKVADAMLKARSK